MARKVHWGLLVDGSSNRRISRVRNSSQLGTIGNPVADSLFLAGQEGNGDRFNINYSRAFSKKVNMQLGLRMEETASTGELIALKPTNNKLVKRQTGLVEERNEQRTRRLETGTAR